MEEEEDDRISQLPDAILHVIISSIDIREAVHTSLLSKRWRFLWSSMSELTFNFHRHTRLNSANRSIHFATHFLSRRDPTAAVTKLRFSPRRQTGRAHDPTFVPRCVDYAVAHGVRVLDVHELRLNSSNFPDSFFSCKSLSQLTLRGFGYGFTIPTKFSLPNVTTLHVEKSSFRYGDDLYNGVKEPFAGFPNLEKLSLHCCSVLHLVIVLPKLKVLEITISENYTVDRPLMERISAPALTALKYQGVLPLECSEVELPILEQVYLESSRKIRRCDGVDNERHVPPERVMRMLQRFGNARVVTLALNTLKVLGMDYRLIEQSPLSFPFPSIKCLKLTKGRSSRVHHPSKEVMDYLTAHDESLVVEFLEDVRFVRNKI